MPHEAAWVAWFSAAKWWVPKELAVPRGCKGVAASSLHHAANPTRQSGYQHYREQRLFSIHVHPPPNFHGYQPNSLFWQQSITDRIQAGTYWLNLQQRDFVIYLATFFQKTLVQVVWGDHSMVVAMRNLLRSAMRDPLNQRFMFLCELTVPLYPPTLVWQQLMAENSSRVNACPIPRKKMKVLLPLCPRYLSSYRESAILQIFADSSQQLLLRHWLLLVQTTSFC